MYGNSDLFGKKKRKKDKVDFLTFRIVLYEVNEISQNSSGRGPLWMTYIL